MSIVVIKATVDCDGCGRQFHTELSNSANLPNGWTLFELAEDYVRGGNCVEGGLCSVQAEMHLCTACTRIADQIGDENYRPTRSEINSAIERASRPKGTKLKRLRAALTQCDMHDDESH